MPHSYTLEHIVSIFDDDFFFKYSTQSQSEIQTKKLKKSNRFIGFVDERKSSVSYLFFSVQFYEQNPFMI